MNDFGLDTDDMEAIHSIFAAYPEIETAVLYGSRASGHFRSGSDIDLVLTGEFLTDRIVLDIRAALSDSDLPYLFDIMADTEVRDENLKQEIEEAGRFFYVAKGALRPVFTY